MCDFKIGDTVKESIHNLKGTVTQVYPDTDEIYVSFPSGSFVGGGYYHKRDVTLVD